MFFYYSRVSTIGQNASRQIENFKAHGHVNAENVYVDKIQGNVPFFERPQAAKLYAKATQNNGESVTIVIDSIDRLGRSLSDIIKSIEVFTAASINLKSLKEGFETMIDGKVNDMSTVAIGVMASISQIERNRIKERQAEGIFIAKASGKFKGRKVGSVQSPKRLLERHPIIVQKLKKNLSIRDIASLTKASTATIMKVKKTMAAMS